ncbi:MAG: energy transducer TonB [Gammaproteobacteria bacterium]
MTAEVALARGPGDGFHDDHKNRRLLYSLGIAIVIEIGFGAWIARAVVHNVTNESKPPVPITVHIVPPPKPKQPPKPKPKIEPKVITPIPTHNVMPNIQPLPVMPKLAQQGAQVLPSISSPAPSPPPNSQYVSSAFFNAVREAIMEQKVFPQDALLSGWSGEVTVSFVYTDGHVSDVKIIKHSRYGVFDQEAEKMILSAHMPPPPPNIPPGQPLLITETIQFQPVSF